MRENLLLCVITGLLVFTTPSESSATRLYLNPQNQMVSVGDKLQYDIFADIDETDAIMGFGFDLSLDGGDSFASGPGYSDGFLRFDNFTPNIDWGFSYDPYYDSDGDSISGFLPFTAFDAFGPAVKLGTFELTVIALKSFSILIGADDIGTYASLEGLVPGFTATQYGSIMPNNPTATATPVPEPASIVLFSAGLAGLAAVRRRSRSRV